MNVIDSSAWLSYLAGDANAAFFAVAIEASETVLVPSVTLVEVYQAVARQRGREAALQVVAHMQAATVVTLDADLALQAGVLGRAHRLPLADSIVYATARRFGAPVWTQDSDFKDLPDVRYRPA